MKENNKYFDNNEMYRNDIKDILTAEETVLWEGSPNKTAYILAAFIKLLPIAVLWLAVDVTIIVIMTNIEGVPWFAWLFFAVHLMPVWLWIGNIIRATLEIKNIRYCVTDKRIIIRDGVIVDLKFLYFTEITNVRVRVGIIDRILKVGDIYITAEFQKAVLYDIKAPYAIGNELQRIVRDIKTDTFYPNALRPETNPGYRTKYVADSNATPADVSAPADKPDSMPGNPADEK